MRFQDIFHFSLKKVERMPKQKLPLQLGLVAKPVLLGLVAKTKRPRQPSQTTVTNEFHKRLKKWSTTN